QDIVASWALLSRPLGVLNTLSNQTTLILTGGVLELLLHSHHSFAQFDLVNGGWLAQALICQPLAQMILDVLDIALSESHDGPSLNAIDRAT
ncbi:hypothetical protein, partial [Ectothiorhodospira mobilis]|uniref:hypothetical protein n=1 Tax=Ectothiorhodospira mobilis TaxID=195064 RepID=UPI001C4350F7